MEVIISGIKCDIAHCNYREDKVSFEEYPKWIDKHCPVCGNNLLSQKDYKGCLRTYRVVLVINILRWVNPFWYIGVIYRFIKGDVDKINHVKVRYENDGSKTVTKE